MTIKISVFFCLLFISISGFGQTFEKTSLGIKARIDSIHIELRFYNPSVVRVIKSVSATATDKSFTVVANPDKTKFSLTKENNAVILISDKLQVRLDLTSGKLQYLTPGGKLLLAEKENSTHFFPFTDMGKQTYHTGQSFFINAGEAIYGLGQQQDGILNQRNKSVLLQQRNMYIGIPFIQTSTGNGIYWDNYSTTTFKDKNGTTSLESEVGDCIDYYFIHSSNADQVIAQMQHLSGKAPMFPRWVFGFWQSRERYQSQAELVGVVKKYRALKVPLDGIVQDWQYWGETRSAWNSTEFGNPKFPQPKLMLDSVHHLNAHMIISVWPSFGNQTAIYKELKAGGYLYNFKTWPEEPSVQVYDAFQPAARDIYWKYIRKNLFVPGMDGWWLDATEPEQDAGQSNFAQTFKGSFNSVRNAFPLLTTGGVYAHQRNETANKRVFILTRSAFAGQQRNATMTWSGDIEGNWNTLRNQIAGGLNLSLSGIPYWNTDIGGFSINAQYPKGIKDLAFHELYVRWLQFATFTPMMRSHGTNTPREIYQFGKKGDWAYDAQEKFINFRYRLLPYIYSEAWQVTNHSSTLMRALVMDFAADPKYLILKMSTCLEDRYL